MGKIKKKCVFCGGDPEKKNKEHILPKWLLRMTGPPNRVVNFGTNPLTGKTIRFSWQALTVPSCTRCNNDYSQLEDEVREIIESLSNKIEINVRDCLKLLDWLDKVRIGLWLNYYYIEQNKAYIIPKYYINHSVGTKDRFMHIHFLESNKGYNGLNAVGVETLSFQFNPSCFGLKINNLFIINGSNDMAISENCGFPFAKKMSLSDTGMTYLENINCDFQTKTDILNIGFYKSVLSIYQPIQTYIQATRMWFQMPEIRSVCIDPEEQIGILFRIKDSKVVPIQKEDKDYLEYENVTGKSVTQLYKLLIKVYTAQNKFIERVAGNDHESFNIAMDYNDEIIKALQANFA